MAAIMFQALRIRDFRLMWAGGLVSSLGSWLLTLAIPTHILLVTGSLRATGLTVAAEYLPLLLLGPVAGVFADRWDRRRLMIGTNLFCAGAVAVMLLGLAPGRYGVLYAALVAENAGVVLYAPAWQARTPAVVGTGSLLSSANALNAASSGVVRLVGGPLGGILLALCGARWLIGIDAASYVLSALALTLTSRTVATASGETASGETASGETASGETASGRTGAVVRDLLEGARVLVRQPVARALFPVTVVYLAANASLSAVLIAFGIRRLGGSEHTGFLLAGLGVGFLAGAPVIRLLLDRVQPRTLLAATLTATAVAYVGLFISSSLAAALPAAAAIGMFGSMSLVIPQTTMQRVVPNAVLGRIGAVFLTGEAAATLAGAAAGPFLAQAAGLTVVAAAAGLVTLAAAVLARLLIPPLPRPLAGPASQSDGPASQSDEPASQSDEPAGRPSPATSPASADPLALSNPWLVPTSTISPRPPTRRTVPPTPTRCRRGTTFPRRKNRRGGPRSPRSPARMIRPWPTPAAASRSPSRSVTRPRSSTPSSPRAGRARWSSTMITPRATMPSSSPRTATGSSRTSAPPTAPGSTTAASSKPSASSAATK
jgi:MFS family permease